MPSSSKREGVPANQANVHAKALEAALAQCTVNPRAFAELRVEVVELRGEVVELRREVVQLRIELVELRKDQEIGFARIDAKFAEQQGQINQLRAPFAMLKWTLGAILALQTGILLKLIA